MTGATRTARTAPVASARGDRRAIWSWALYDFANSPFTTLIVTFLYPVYFAQAIVGDGEYATTLWSRAITITALVVAFASPVLGAYADRSGFRKRLLTIMTLASAAATAALFNVLPGEVLTALVLFVIANVAYEFAGVFYNAFLTDLAPPQRVGSVSGIGWGLGYFGGLLALAAALVGLIQPETPWFGFSTEAGENVRAINLLVAVWFIVFTIPLWLFVHEDRSRISPRGQVVSATLRQLKRTFSELRKHEQIWRFLIARLVYNDGLVTVFAFGGLYASTTFGFTLDKVLVFGIVINLAAGIGAALMGFLDDRVGGKRTIIVSLFGLIGATALAVLATAEVWLWVAGVLIGIFSGPNQSASRSLMARFVPHDAENEFFGFFAFSGKLTAFAGPFLLGVLTQVSGSQRVGVSVVIVMFVVGLVLLLRVDEREGAKVRRSEPGIDGEHA
jgi:UMF1 family MFS transporter